MPESFLKEERPPRWSGAAAEESMGPAGVGRREGLPGGFVFNEVVSLCGLNIATPRHPGPSPDRVNLLTPLVRETRVFPGRDPGTCGGRCAP